MECVTKQRALAHARLSGGKYRAGFAKKPPGQAGAIIHIEEQFHGAFLYRITRAGKHLHCA
jgi:hypothetical protein